MRLIGKALVWVAALGGCAYFFEWTSLRHLVWGGAFALGLAAFLFLWRRRRAQDDDEPADEFAEQSRLRLTIGGLIRIAGFLSFLWVCFFMLDRLTPHEEPNPDSDRIAFEEKLSTLESAGQFDRAAGLIEERLKGKATPAWSLGLALRLYQDRVFAGKSGRIPVDKRKQFALAREVARKYGLDDTSAVLLDDLVHHEAERESHLNRLRGKKQWAELAVLCEANLLQPIVSTDEKRVASEWRDVLVAWGKELSDSAEKKRRFEKALFVARKYGLEEHSPQLALTLLTQELESRLMPLALPAGAKAHLVQLSTKFFPPAVVVDVAVDNASGEFVEGLVAKDFRVTHSWEPVEFTSALVSRDAERESIVLAIDTSGSMADALDIATKGAEEFLSGIARTHQHSPPAVQILRFSDHVYQMCDWTTDYDRAKKCLLRLKADGQTALFNAAAVGVEHLKGRPGRRRILVLTDGADNVGGRALKDVIDSARRNSVEIHVIGLRTTELDVPTLKKLADETGGTYSEAAEAKHLLEHYREASRLFRPRFYRLILTKGIRDLYPIEIDIGGVNKIRLSVQLGK